jgi:hypothetical protein
MSERERMQTIYTCKGCLLVSTMQNGFSQWDESLPQNVSLPLNEPGSESGRGKLTVNNRGTLQAQ